MASSEELSTFIATSFRSVWALEVLLLLKRESRTLSIEELVAFLRASKSVVAQARDSLVAAGLAASDGLAAQYVPANTEIAALVEETERIYATAPGRVRRAIMAAWNPGLIAFSNAFRLKD